MAARVVGKFNEEILSKRRIYENDSKDVFVNNNPRFRQPRKIKAKINS